MFDPMSFLTSLGLKGGFGAPDPNGWSTAVTRGATSPSDMNFGDAFRHAVTGTTDKSLLGTALGGLFGGGAKAMQPQTSPTKTSSPSPGPAPPPPGRNIAQVTQAIRGGGPGPIAKGGPGPRARPAFSPFGKA
jgi:hypothetical protein